MPKIISAPRFATYLKAVKNSTIDALELYQWNLQISSAFIIPLQICEVAARNGVTVALEKKYGADRYQSKGFLKSLRSPKNGYSLMSYIMQTTRKLREKDVLTSGKVVAELKFIFWERMLTERHHDRLWKAHFIDAFPHADISTSVYMVRGNARQHLEKIRKFHNRIAHHEPIFFHDIDKEYQQILEVIRWRSPISANWVDNVQNVTALNAQKPKKYGASRCGTSKKAISKNGLFYSFNRSSLINGLKPQASESPRC